MPLHKLTVYDLYTICHKLQKLLELLIDNTVLESYYEVYATALLLERIWLY